MRILFTFLLLMLLPIFGKSLYDSTFQVYEAPTAGYLKVMAYTEQAKSLIGTDDSTSLRLSLEALAIAKGLSVDTLTERCLLRIGLAYDFLGNTDSAMHYYNLVQRSAKHRGEDEMVAQAIFSKGNMYYYQRQYAEAIAYYDSAAQYWTLTGNLERVSKVLNNMGIVYRLRNNYSKAIETYLRSIDIKKQLADSMGLGNSYFNLGKAYYHNDEYHQSELQLRNALHLFELLEDSHQAATAKSTLSTTLIALERIDEAESLLNEALPLLEQRKNVDFIHAMCSFALIDRSKGKPNSALERLLPYYDLVVESNLTNMHITFEEELAAAYADLGDYERAHHHQGNYLRLFKELANEGRERLAEEMQARFETREKENKINLQELEIAKNAQEKRVLSLGTALVVVLFLAALVFAVIKLRGNRKLAAEKAKTEALLRDRETLLREIHHRVKNNLQVVSSLLSIQSREITDDKAQQAVNESRNRVQSMALIHQFLYGEENLSSIDMSHYVNELSHKLFDAYRMDHDQVALHVQVDSIMLDVDTAIPVGLILNELITNALKYAFPEQREGNLWVTLQEKNEMLTLQVRDDGVGFGQKGDSKKTSSFGMKLLNAFKQKLDATFEIQHTDGGVCIDYQIRKYKVSQKI